MLVYLSSFVGCLHAWFFNYFFFCLKVYAKAVLVS